ncbi:MAG: DUF2877 domain-containing protein [Neisseriaceae bacterium]|nr:DUF2877 domain-containing protein [Neisseriaceae bacterium]
MLPQANALLTQPLSMDDRFLSTLRQSERWRIHSAFANTVNLSAPSLPLLTLSNQQTDTLPLSLMTQGIDFSPLQQRLGTAIQHDAHSLRLSDAYVFYLNPPARSHYFAAASLDEAQRSSLKQALPALQQQLTQQARPGSFVPTAHASPFEQALGQCLRQQAQALGQALQQTAAAPNLDTAVLGLLGLGVGLTPSGDDYLVGALAALRYTQPHADATQALAASIQRHAPAQTNAISVQALGCACQYYFKSSLLDLLQSLAQQQPQAAAAALGQLLHTGSTSGTDLAYGLIDTLLLSCFEKDVL